jgi:uncharacterized protein YfaS (alpha-2-macroglobulin family)
MNMKATLIALLVSLSVAYAQEDVSKVETRKEAEKLRKQGNWKDALELDRKLLGQSDDSQSWKDLEHAFIEVARLNQMSEVDALIEDAVADHPENWSLLRQAARSYWHSQHWGYLLDGEFRRGQHRGGGQYIGSADRDRVRAIQLMRMAIKKGADQADANNRAGMYEELARLVQMGRMGRHQVWGLGVLTPLEILPDYGEEAGRSSGSGAPVDEEGNILVISVPKSWEGARNDGERWRWAIAESVRILPGRKSLVENQWAQFLVQHYGVRTLSGYGWWRQSDPDEAEGVLQVHTLKESETIASLAAGVKRFHLPEDYQFIPLLRQLSRGAGSNPSAGDLLVQIFLDRRQYQQAAVELNRVIEVHGKGHENHRQNLLNQIQHDWGRFESASMYQAGEKILVDFVYRNAQEVRLSLHSLKVDKVVSDLFRHLESNPRKIDQKTINIGAIGQRLVQDNQKKYLDQKVKDWRVDLTPREGHWDSRAQIELPTSKAGAYLLEAKAGEGNTSWTVVWISDSALVTQQLKDGKLVYFGESKAGTPLSGEIEFFGYRVIYRKGAKGLLRKFDVKTKRVTKKIGADGSLLLDKESLDPAYQWMAVARGSDQRRALLGFHSHRWRDYHVDRLDLARAYGLTDRPVYRPEQKVHLKFWARTAKYDLGDVSLHANKRCTVEIHHQSDGKVHEVKNLRTDEFGGVELDYVLPADARLGQYYVHLKGDVPGGSVQFRVEEYKKPEFEVTIKAPTKPVRLGEEIEAEVIATYYHGAPVSEGTVKVKVQRYSHTERWFPRGQWDWLYGEGYWWFGRDYDWYPGWGRWGCRTPVPSWMGRGRWTPPELVLEREYQIGADGRVKVVIDTAIAKLVHGDMDHRYEISAEVVDSSRRAIYGKGNVLAARRPFTTTVWLDQGFARPGGTINASFTAKTLDGREVKVTGAGDLYRVRLDAGGKVKEERIEGFKLQPSLTGEGVLRFKAPAAGQYRFAVTLTDEKGNKEEGGTVFVVRKVADDGSGSRFNALELVLDKKDYQPGDEAKLLVNANQKGSTVLLLVRSNGRTADELRMIRIEGKSKEVSIKLSQGDMPNIFVQAITFSNGRVVLETKQIVLPPVKRLLRVEVEPAKTKYKPREKGTLKLRLKDEHGEPYEGTAVVTVYDKSLEYVSGGSNVGNIREFFWSWKRAVSNYGLTHSQYLSGGNINKIKAIAMQTLGRFGANLAEFGRRGLDGGGGGGLLKAAAPMARMASRDERSLEDSEIAPMEAIDVAGKKRAPAVVVRSEFADLIKWAGSVTTNELGEAEIEVEYPDNLTTWKVKVWALGHGTRVGEGSAEVITSKDLIVRLQAPRFFVESDEVVLSAVVHNYHDVAKEVDVSLELEGGTLHSLGSSSSRIVIPAGGEKRIDWLTVAKTEGEVTVRMKAIASDDSDAMEMTFPVYVHGMSRTESWSRAIRPEGSKAVIDFDVPAERRPDQTRLEIRYSPTVAGAMVDALPYLANYPYGCTEQTLNRFVPTVITQRLLQDMQVDLQAVKNKRANLNPQEIGGAQGRAAQWKRWQENPVWDKDEVDKMVRKGVKRLREMQNHDGGWGWFSAYGERSYPHTTAVVVHGLTVARANGAKVQAEMLKRGVAWLKKHEGKEAERIRMWKKRRKNTKQRADAQDALVRRVLGEAGEDDEEMLGFLYRDKGQLPVYAKCLLGLELHRSKEHEKRDAVITNIEQFLELDDENQTAWLELGNGGYWWHWYGSEFEAHAWYLKLLAVAKPRSPQASGLVKYLVNNRKNATYWRSTRDTAYCIEAISDYLRASKEDSPEMEVDVVLDGKVLKTVRITKENLFSFDGTAVVAGDVVGTGAHRVELRKRGVGPLYANVYLTVFSKEEFLKKAGLEVKVERTLYKLIPVKALQDVAGSRGQALKQRKEKYERVKLVVGGSVESGDLIEVELSVESKNDYSYLLFEDRKAAGLEAVEVRSGHSREGGLASFVEYRDEKVALFVRSLPRGRHNLSYRLRAEIPGTFSALPARVVGMYAPELRGNSDEMKLIVRDRP